MSIDGFFLDVDDKKPWCKMSKYQYELIPISNTASANQRAKATCNLLGREGWELVAISKDENGLDLYWFKLRQPTWWEKLWDKLTDW